MTYAPITVKNNHKVAQRHKIGPTFFPFCMSRFVPSNPVRETVWITGCFVSLMITITSSSSNGVGVSGVLLLTFGKKVWTHCR